MISDKVCHPSLSSYDVGILTGVAEEKPKQNFDTRYSLIERIQGGVNHRAWDEFVGAYRPFIFYLLNQMNVRVSEQDDLVQEVLLKLHKNIGVYEKEKGRFRNWFGVVIRNVVNSYLSKLGRLHTKHHEFAESLEVVGAYSQSELEEKIESEWKRYLANEALAHLRTIFSENMVECFRLTMENVPVDEIAKRLDVKKETVYMIRMRMKSRMLLEMQNLMEKLEPNR